MKEQKSKITKRAITAEILEALKSKSITAVIMLTTPIWIDYMEDYLIAVEPRNGYLETYMKEAHEFYWSGLNEEQMINILDQIALQILTRNLK